LRMRSSTRGVVECSPPCPPSFHCLRLNQHRRRSGRQPCSRGWT
jgi:hypothetical protein